MPKQKSCYDNDTLHSLPEDHHRRWWGLVCVCAVVMMKSLSFFIDHPAVGDCTISEFRGIVTSYGDAEISWFLLLLARGIIMDLMEIIIIYLLYITCNHVIMIVSRKKIYNVSSCEISDSLMRSYIYICCLTARDGECASKKIACTLVFGRFTDDKLTAAINKNHNTKAFNPLIVCMKNSVSRTSPRSYCWV